MWFTFVGERDARIACIHQSCLFVSVWAKKSHVRAWLWGKMPGVNALWGAARWAEGSLSALWFSVQVTWQDAVNHLSGREGQGREGNCCNKHQYVTSRNPPRCKHGVAVLPVAWFPPHLCNRTADPLAERTSDCATFWRIPLASWATHTWWHPGVRAPRPYLRCAGGCCGTCTARPSRQLWSAKTGKAGGKSCYKAALLLLKLILSI